MKVAILLVGLLAIASVVPIHSAPIKVGDLLDDICPEVLAEVSDVDHTVLLAVLKALAAADASIEIPDGENIAIIAPNDDAFNSIIAELDLSGGKGLSDIPLLTALAEYHFATFTNATAKELKALNGATIPVLGADGKPSTIAKVATSGKGKVKGVSNTVSITEATACPDGKINFWVADAVLTPPASGPQRPAAFDAALAAAGPAAGPAAAVVAGTKVGDLIAGLCPEVLAEVSDVDHTVLLKVLKALEAADASLDIPEGENIAIIAPNDDAFKAIIAELGLAEGEGINDTALLTALADYHIATFTDGEASTLTALNGATIPVLGADGKPSTIAAVATAGSGKVQGVSNTVSVTKATACPDGKINFWVADAVLKPPAAGPQRPDAFGPANTATAPAAGPTGAAASGVMVGDLIADLCPEVLAEVTDADHTVMLAVLKALEAADASLDIPEGENIAIIAPNDEAFKAIIAELGLSGGKGLSDIPLLAALAEYHIATFTDADASTMTGLNGATLTVLGTNNETSTIGAVAAAGMGEVKGVSNTVNILKTLSCDKGKINLWVADAVLLPPASGEQRPDAFDAATAGSSASIASMGMAAALAVVVAMI